jgi:hypothetical protein
MSSFSADWLALREPADHRARDPQLAEILAHFLNPRTSIKLVDLYRFHFDNHSVLN